MLKHFFWFYLLFLCPFFCFGQEKSLFNNDYLDPFITNPATTGVEDYPVAHLSARKQWMGFPDSPSTFLISGNYRIGNFGFYNPKMFVNKSRFKIKDRVGLGGMLFHDINGPLSNTGGMMSYGFHSDLNPESKLSFGLSVLMVDYKFNSSLLEPNDKNDSYLLTGFENTFRVNINVGTYYHTRSYFVGASMCKLISSIDNMNQPTQFTPSYFLMGGYKFNNNPDADFQFEPSFRIKKLGDEPIMFDIYSKLYVKSKNWVAISYSSSNQMNAFIVLNVYKMMYVGYAYGYTFGNIASYNYGTHEVSLGINLGLVGVEGVLNNRYFQR